MPSPTAQAIRYVRTWFSQSADLEEREVMLHRDDATVPASYLRPKGDGPVPAWIVLHGITRPGRAHAQLVRFTRAIGSTGCAVLVPEVPEWRELELAPGLTVPTIRAAVKALQDGPLATGGNIAIVGFSFGAPQAMTAAGDPEIGRAIRGVVGFGGYCDLERTVRFQFTGEHEWEGHRHHLRPDPYGRWILGANYLTSVPEYEDMDDVAQALRTLAASAGDQGIVAWDERFQVEGRELATRLEGRHREVFELFAPPDGSLPERSAAEAMVTAISATARRVDPTIEPGDRLAEVRCPVHLIHGRNDHLIPFSEGLRLAAALPPEAHARSTVTPLFGHSSQDAFPGPLRSLREGYIFLRALRSMLGMV